MPSRSTWKPILATWIPTWMQNSKNRKTSARLRLEQKTSGMKMDANKGTIPWKICWRRSQKEQASSLTWQTIHWERQKSLFCLQKTLRHVKLRPSQSAKAARPLKTALLNDRRSTNFKQMTAASSHLLHSWRKKSNNLWYSHRILRCPIFSSIQHPSGDQRPLLSGHDETFLLSNGLNPGAILDKFLKLLTHSQC